MPRIGPLAAQIVEHRKADPADHDGAHHRCQDQRIGGIADQTVAVNREPGVVECRNGVEQPAPGCIAPGEVVCQVQAQGEQQHHRQLHHQRHHQNELRHAGDVTQPQHVGFGLGDQLGSQVKRAVDQQPEQCGQGHHAETAELEQQHDYHLAEGRPIGAGVDHHQTGNADR